MTPQPQILPRLKELLDALFDDRLTSSEATELNALLETSPEACDAYVLCVDLEANIRRLHASQPLKSSGDLAKQQQQRALAALQGGEVAPGEPKLPDSYKTATDGALSPSRHAMKVKSVRPNAFKFSNLSAWRIAAIFIFIASAVFTLTSPTWTGWWKTTPVATLADAVDAQWDMPQTRLDVGDHLPYGSLFLKSGYANIRLDNGVKLVVVGPAHFSVDSLKLAHLDEGKLTVDVPHISAASGFAVKIPSGMVTDIGTTFGVTAFANGESTVQVLKGSVQAKLFSDDGKQNQQVVLTADHAIALSPFTGTLASIPVEQDDYVTDIHHLPVAPAEDARYARWSQYSTQLRKDPSLLAYYTFDNNDEASGKLLNRAAATSGQHDGQIENAKWDNGRFPGKQALRFNGIDSRVRVNIPEQSNQLTVAIWYQMDSWAHEWTSLLDTDLWNRDGSIACQFADDHRYSASVQNQNPKPWFSQYSPEPFTLDGHWVHLVATFDAQASQVVIYRNGVALPAKPSVGPVPMSIGAAQIGNWDAPSTDPFPNRTLDGRIDELAVFSRVLSPSEIEAMYKAGRDDK